MADSNTVALRYLAETEWGTTPAAAMTELRKTGESFGEMEDTTESGEIIADRQLRELVRTGRASQGGPRIELAYGAHDALIEAALCGTWTADILENGAVRRSFTIEKEIVAEDGTSHFLIFRGWRPGTLNLRFALNSIVTGDFGGIGKGMVPAAATAGTGAPIAAPATLPMSAVSITGISTGGAPMSGVSEVTLAADNALRRKGQLGPDSLFGIGLGGFRARGTLVQYFQDRALIQDYVDRVVKELSVATQDEVGNAYEFLVPRARLGAPQVVAEGPNGDVEVRFTWTGTKDAGATERTLILERTPAL